MLLKIWDQFADFMQMIIHYNNVEIILMSWKIILIMILKFFMNGQKNGYYSLIHRKQKLYFLAFR